MPVLPFLLVFTCGLTIAVYTMLHGVTAAPTARAVTRIGRISAPSVAAFAVVFGAVGYLCFKHTTMSYPFVTLLALLAGGATIPLSAPLLASIARNRNEPSAADVSIEGHLAKVVSLISHSTAGEIVYQQEGRDVRRRALNLLTGTLEVGRDVVIDRVDADLAYVEDWESVEKRL